MNAAAARNQYRTLRAASALSAKDFDSKCFTMAHEMADGEEVLPRHWVEGAAELLYRRGEWREGLL